MNIDNNLFVELAKTLSWSWRPPAGGRLPRLSVSEDFQRQKCHLVHATSPGINSDSGVKPESLALTGKFFAAEPTRKPGGYKSLLLLSTSSHIAHPDFHHQWLITQSPPENHLVASLWTSAGSSNSHQATNLLSDLAPSCYFYPRSRHSASPGARSTHTGLSHHSLSTPALPLPEQFLPWSSYWYFLTISTSTRRHILREVYTEHNEKEPPSYSHAWLLHGTDCGFTVHLHS